MTNRSCSGEKTFREFGECSQHLQDKFCLRWVSFLSTVAFLVAMFTGAWLPKDKMNQIWLSSSIKFDLVLHSFDKNRISGSWYFPQMSFQKNITTFFFFFPPNASLEIHSNSEKRELKSEQKTVQDYSIHRLSSCNVQMRPLWSYYPDCKNGI